MSRARATLLALALALAPAARADDVPRRVASINLSADEVLAEILPPERLVAVTSFVDDPEMSNAVGRVPASVRRLPKADLEQLVALSPDLVVVSDYTDADFLRLLSRSGLRHHRMRGQDSLEGIREAILELGRAVGAAPAARVLVARYDATLAELHRSLAGARRPRVLYWSGGMTAGAGTAIGALIEAAGAVNVGRELGLTGIEPPGAERALVADPDVILVGTWPNALESVTRDPLLSRSRAVRSGHVLQLPTRRLVALSQYAADAAWELAARLHPRRVSGPRP
jgi:ABC-type Fe3+-hydroxamate transport system substrate-binding protein